jgi:hypothetical protein
MPRVRIAGRAIANWGDPQSLAWGPFVADLAAARGNGLVIVEGFILFAHPAVAPLCDALIALEFDDGEMEVAMDRRVRRAVGRAAPANYREAPFQSRAHSAAAYFHEVVWPEMLRHPEYMDPRGWGKPRLALRATDSLEQNMAAALVFLKSLL